MRIRKRFAPSYFSSEPLADLHLNQSLSNGNQAKPKSDQPSNPPQQPSDQNMVIIKWALHPNAAITGKRKVGVCLKTAPRSLCIIFSANMWNFHFLDLLFARKWKVGRMKRSPAVMISGNISKRREKLK